MSVAVLVPWRDVNCPYRDRALAWVTTRLARYEWPVVVGRHHDGPWCKAAAVADALAQTDAEVLVVHDADVLTDGLPEAVARVRGGIPWAVPHRGVFRLTEDSTQQYMAGEPLDGLALAERAYLGVEAGGVTVITREAYETVPLDPRFLGWGSEDEAHGFALRALVGVPWRGKAPLVHLYHPPQERARRSFGSLQSYDLRKRYARARSREAAMLALVKEAHDALSTLEPPAHAGQPLRSG